MSEQDLSPLEEMIFTRYHDRYAEFGFPEASKVSVTRRDNYTSGRIVFVSHPGIVVRLDGRVGIGNYSQFDMNGLDYGASFWVEIENMAISYLEIVVNGDKPWTGIEDNFVIRDPDTGELPI